MLIYIESIVKILILSQINSFSSLIFFLNSLSSLERSRIYLPSLLLIYCKISKNKRIISYLFLKLTVDSAFNFFDYSQHFFIETFIILIKFELLSSNFTKRATPHIQFVYFTNTATPCSQHPYFTK